MYLVLQTNKRSCHDNNTPDGHQLISDMVPDLSFVIDLIVEMVGIVLISIVFIVSLCILVLVIVILIVCLCCKRCRSTRLVILIAWFYTSKQKSLSIIRSDKAALGEHKPSTEQLEMENNAYKRISTNNKNTHVKRNEYKNYPWQEERHVDKISSITWLSILIVHVNVDLHMFNMHENGHLVKRKLTVDTLYVPLLC